MAYSFLCKFKFLFFFSLFFVCFTSPIPTIAYEDDDDFEEGSEFCPSRFSFLATCENHFANNISIMGSWMEADDKETISSFYPYLHLLPKINTPECTQCPSCGGVEFDLYYGCDWPTNVTEDDYSAYEELKKGHIQSMRGYGKQCHRSKTHCDEEELCWNGGYFRRWNHKYVHFFKHYLQYCSENEECECYWPEFAPSEATDINNRVYQLFRNLAEEGLITYEFSSFWKANYIDFDYYKKFFSYEYYPNSHGMASSLTTYTFFYSQYHQILLSVAAFIDANSIFGSSRAIDRIYSTLEKIRDDFSSIYYRCLRHHPHPKTYYERGMLKMHSGHTEDALADISRLMRLAKSEKYKNKFTLTSEMYQQEGQLYADSGMYDKSIHALSEAIRLDPNNRGAHFARAQAYFERGEFDLALADHLASHVGDNYQQMKLRTTWEVKDAVLNGLAEGGKEGAIEFVPSLCETAYGLGKALWIHAQHPIDSTTEFVNACYDLSKNTYELFKDVEWDNIETYPNEIIHLHNNFDRLSDVEKAHFVGYAIGKYGVDIFAGGVALKSIVALKKLKNANALCNMEAMAMSQANKEVVLSSALKHTVERESFFKNVKIHADRQNKHVFGKHNYQAGKSIFEHSDPQGLLNKFAGKGNPIKDRIPGSPDYREKVNFGELIGHHVNEFSGLKTQTTWGEIRYSKTGAHIVPALPE